MNGTILYQFVGSPNDPLTEEMMGRFFRFCRTAVKLFKSNFEASIKDSKYSSKTKENLETIMDINVTASEILKRLDTSNIKSASTREDYKEQIALVVQETNKIINLR